MDAESLGLFADLADPERHGRAVEELAARLGGSELIVFLHDPEVGTSLPAPGFPQTLKGGRAWRQFLERCVAVGEHSEELPWRDGATAASGVAEDGTILVVTGGAPRLSDLRRLRGVLPLVAAALRGERTARQAEVQARLAGESAAQAAQLATTLDAARAELQDALQQAGEARRTVEIAEARLREVFVRAPAIIATLRGPTHVYESANPLYLRTIGNRDILGKSVAEALPEVVEQGIIDLLDRVYQSGEPFVANELRVLLDRREDGVLDEAFFNFVYEPLFEADGSVSGILVHAVEVTDQVRARQRVEEQAAELERMNDELQSQASQLEESQAELEMVNDELQRANTELADQRETAERAQSVAEEADRAKSAFLANMSHELRTPINAIIGYTELTEIGIAGPLTDAQRTNLERISSSSQHLLSLVNEVLDLAKVESGQMQIDSDRVAVAETIQEALDLVGPQAARRQIEIRGEVTAETSPTYYGDADRVRQILVNLLSNAVKFTEPGGWVAIACGVEERPDSDTQLLGDGPWLRIDVEDIGVGIPHERIGQIFEPFFQVDGGYTRESGGTGLGLTISRRLARMMGGDLTVRSRVGEGSCFTVWLPASVEHAGEEGEHTRARPSVPHEVPGTADQPPGMPPRD